jgi:hypothetical protein
MADTEGFGLTSLAIAIVGGIAGGWWLRGSEAKADRRILANEFRQVTRALKVKANTQQDIEDIERLETGVKDLEQGRIPCHDEDGYVAALRRKGRHLWTRLRHPLGGAKENGDTKGEDTKVPAVLVEPAPEAAAS